MTIDLSGEWDFSYTVDGNTIPDGNSFEASMPVPGCWDDNISRLEKCSFWKNAKFNTATNVQYPTTTLPPHAELAYLLGVGWYRKEIDVPTAWQGGQVTLNVGRIVMRAKVFVNGQLVYSHFGYSTTWKVPLTSHLKYGSSNELIIAVDNTPKTRYSCIIKGYAGQSSGIFGPVTMKVAGRAAIADVYAWPDGNEIKWDAELQGDIPAGAKLQWRLVDSQNHQIACSGTAAADELSVKWKSSAEGLKWWSDEKPNLYIMEVELWAGENRIDLLKRPFGLRRLTAEGFKLRLNGKPIYLRGVCDHSDYPVTVTPPDDVKYYRSHITRLKELGFNWLRFHSSVPLEPYLEAADQLGMLVQVETGVGMQQQEWLDIYRFCRKHPSVVIYCGGNEELLDDEKIEFLRQRCAEMRELVPEALFNPQEALRGVEYSFEEINFGSGIVKEPYPHNPVRLEKLKSFCDVFGQYSWGYLSYFTPTDDAALIDERLAVYQRPCLTHELGILGCYINLDLRDRVPSRVGTKLYDNVRQNLTQAGLIDKASLYYRNSCAWQRILFKDAIETARKCKHLAGYDLLGANDTTWLYHGYNCGMMNEYDEVKPGSSVQDILRYNNPSVLLLAEQRKRNLLSGQDFRNEVLLSWFGEKVLRGAHVECTLTAANSSTVLYRDRQRIKAVSPGNLENIMSLAFKVPSLSSPAKVTLTVRLTNAETELSNSWYYWIFPAVSLSSPPDVIEVCEMDPNTAEKLMQGAKVIMYGYKPLPTNPVEFRIGLAGRPSGNLATIITDHPLTNSFPNEGFCDWQFKPMIASSNAVAFNTPELEKIFDPIIEVASTYKNIVKQACLFELQVGKGRLLVCTMNLSLSDPGVVYMKHCILSYAAGEQFKPRTCITPHEFSIILVQAAPAYKELLDENRAYDKQAQLKDQTGAGK